MPKFDEKMDAILEANNKLPVGGVDGLAGAPGTLFFGKKKVDKFRARRAPAGGRGGRI